MNSRAVALAALLTVVIVWQVPHTIWLRYTLLIGLGVLAWPVALLRLVQPATALERVARAPFAALAALLSWALAVAFAVSPNSASSLGDLRAEWLAPALILLAGFGLALRYREGHVVVRVLFLGFVLHAFMQLVTAGYVLLRGDAINFMNFGGIGDHKANVTYTNAFALAMLVADEAARARGAPGFLRIDTRWALGAFALLLASTILATTRNGLVVFALMAVLGFVVIAGELRARTSRAAWATLVACGLIVFIGAIVGLRADPRWSTFFATAPVAWDTDHNRQWLQGERDESNLPPTASGKPVEPSAYFRLAFLHEGLRLIAEHPWGTRVGRDAFRLAIRDKYGRGGMSHAHNGFLDLGASLGLPGLALWIVFLGSFIFVAARAREAAGSGLRMALVLVIVGYAARTLLDATVRDHILQEFMITAGALCAAIVVAGPRDSA